MSKLVLEHMHQSGGATLSHPTPPPNKLKHGIRRRFSTRKVENLSQLSFKNKVCVVTRMQDGLAMEASGEGSSGAKINTKQQAHNEKERLRRMNLNASYSALSYILPNNSRRSSKKRWSAPKIIDRALTYIPELQNEIERLTLEKEQRTLKKEAHKNHNNNVVAADTTSSLTITQVAKGEFIIQVCAKGGVLSGLMRKVEDQGMSVKSASRVDISDDRICYHLHIEIDAEPSDKDYIAVLRDQLASWLD